MWSVQWPTQTVSSALAFHFLKRDEKPHFIIFWLKDPWDSAVPKKKQSPLPILCPSPPRKILSPPKQVLKICFSFLLTALFKLEDVSEGLVVSATYFQIPIWLSKDSPPPLPKWIPQKAVMELAIWHRWCHLWNSTGHFQPSLPNCELPAQWVLGKWNWQMKFRLLMYYLQLSPERRIKFHSPAFLDQRKLR